jgi:DNA-binding SARP family transcriptional activator/tetratricopeptide (TPR) repeat protein
MCAEIEKTVRVQLLGPVRVWRGGCELEVGAPQQRAVLGVLAARANRAVSRGELVDAVWGHDPPVHADSAVYTYVAGLRRLLEPERRRGASSQVLTSTGPGYLLRLDPEEVDVAAFDRLVGQARRQSDDGELTSAVDSFDAALGLWYGTPWSGVPGPFAEVERTRLGQLRLNVLEERGEIMLALGRCAQLAAELPVVVREHPLRERLYGLLMHALYLCGRQAEALEIYQLARHVLVEELGIEPASDLRRLRELVLSADPALDLPTGSSDSRPKREYPYVRPSQLPHDATDLTGRHDELSRLRALLPAAHDDEPGRAVVICAIDGAAGVGKTALAIHFAHQVGDRFADGEMYLDLRGFDPRMSPMEPREALTVLLRGLRVEPDQIPIEVEEQASLFRSLVADKRVLLVLDNAASAEQVRPLLPGRGGSLVIVTSRRRLRGLAARDGAHNVTLDTLTPAEASTLLERIIGFDRVSAEPGAAARLAELCGYLPLALRIAADRVLDRTVGLTELVDELADQCRRLDVLDAGDDQTAVRAVFSWSYRALKPELARTFRLLGLHVGPKISTPAAAAVVGTTVSGAREQLDALANMHLIQQVRPYPGWYRFHDLLRVYAAERAASEESSQDRDAALERLLNWYLHTADNADRMIDPQRCHLPLDPLPIECQSLDFASPAQALDWCESERAALVALTRLAGEIGQDTICWKLPVVMMGYFYLRKPWSDWIAASETGLAAARRAQDEIGEAWALTNLGLAHFDAGHLDQAMDHQRLALDLWHRSGDRLGEGTTLTRLGNGYRALHRFDEAIEAFERALSIRREIGDGSGVGITLAGLGGVYRALGRFDDAIDYLQQALTVHRAMTNRWGEAIVETDLGETHGDVKQVEQSIGHYQSALTIYNEIGNRHGQVRTLRNLAEAFETVGHAERAQDFRGRALAIENATDGGALNHPVEEPNQSPKAG